MKIPSYNGKKLDKETMDKMAELIFSETPEERQAIQEAVDKKINDNIQLMIDRGYDVTELVKTLNTPKA